MPTNNYTIVLDSGDVGATSDNIQGEWLAGAPQIVPDVDAIVFTITGPGNGNGTAHVETRNGLTAQEAAAVEAPFIARAVV